MAAQTETKGRSLVMDKKYARQLADEMNRLIGFVPDPTATALQAQQQLLDSGVRPEDNEFSCEIIRSRERNMPMEPK